MRSRVNYLLILGLAISMAFGETSLCTEEKEISEPIYDLEELTKVPVPDRSKMKIHGWPIDGKLEVEGLVVIKYVITKEGKTRNVHVERSTDERLSEIAIENVEGWEFEPGEIEGVSVNVRVRMPIPFRLSNTEQAAGGDATR